MSCTGSHHMICLSLAFSRFKLARDTHSLQLLCVELPLCAYKEKPARQSKQIVRAVSFANDPTSHGNEGDFFALILKFSAWVLAALLELPISGAAYMYM